MTKKRAIVNLTLSWDGPHPTAGPSHDPAVLVEALSAAASAFGLPPISGWRIDCEVVPDDLITDRWVDRVLSAEIAAAERDHASSEHIAWLTNIRTQLIEGGKR